MRKKILVTSDQTNAVRKKANEKGITRAEFQMALNDGRIGKFLGTLFDVKNVDLATLTPPPGAILHIVSIRFKPDRKWREAIKAGGPYTPSHYNVRKQKVEDQYPPTGTEEIEEDLILLNFPSAGGYDFPNSGGYDKANAWAASNKLQMTDPREVFAIAEQHPRLNKRLEQNPICVVATKEYTLEGHRVACCVWWSDSKRGADLRCVSGFDNSFSWIAFRKPAPKT